MAARVTHPMSMAFLFFAGGFPVLFWVHLHLAQGLVLSPASLVGGHGAILANER